MHHDVGGPYHDVDAVLRSHDADIGGEKPPAPAQLGGGGATSQPLGIRAGADDRDVSGRLATSCRGDAPVGLVGRDHVVGGPVSPALEGSQDLVGQLRAIGETGLVKLGTQVVMV